MVVCAFIVHLCGVCGRCLNELMMVDPGELHREDPKENVLLARIRDLQVHGDDQQTRIV